MEQLLEIRTIPVQMELRCKEAQTRIKTEHASLNVTRDRGALRVMHSYPRLRIDTYETRSSMNLMSVARSVEVYAQKGMQAAYEATGRIVREGNMLMDISGNQNAISDIIYQRMQNGLDSMLGFIPSVPAKITWDPPRLSMQYDADRLSFEWRTYNRPEYEYTPASVEYVVKQYPKLEIEYKGRPVYVPPTADPEYDPEADDLLQFDITA